MSCVAGSAKAYVWNPADTNIYVISQPASPVTSAVDLTFAPVAFESASDRSRYYAAKSGFSQLFIFNSDTNQLVGTVNLPDEPQNLAYNPGTGKLYISYKTSLTISRLDVGSGTLDAFSGAAGSPPALISTRKGTATEGVFAIWPSGGRYHLFEYDTSGVIIRNVTLDLMQPSDIEFVTSGYVYLSNFGTNTVTRVLLSDNSTRSIGVGSLPKKMIVSGSDGVYVINSGNRSLTLVRNAAVVGTYTMQPLPLDGDSACFAGRMAVVEDIWSISTRVQGVLSATIKDSSSNTGSATRNIYVKPETIGP